MKAHRRYTCAALGVLAVGCLVLTAAAEAEVTAEPSKVVLEGPKDAATIKLMQDGKALSGKALTGYKVMATGTDYAHMINVKKTDEGIVVTPSDTVEIGSYDLVLQTQQGNVTVKLETPLEKLDNIVEQRAKALGISKEEAQKRLGLTTDLPHPEVSIELPAVYYDGQTLSIDMPKEAGKSYMWSINGRVVAQGPDANNLMYTFTEPGAYVVTYHEMKDGNVIAADSAMTVVSAAPATPWKVENGKEFTLEAPPGYDAYAWEINDNYVGSGPKLTHTFDAPGTYLAECTATKTGDPGYDRFRYVIQATSN